MDGSLCWVFWSGFNLIGVPHILLFCVNHIAFLVLVYGMVMARLRCIAGAPVVCWWRGTVVSMVVLGCVLAALAVVLLLVGALAWTRHLPGNKYVGIKVPEVRESREVWDAVHQFAGPLWLASGVAMAVAAVPPFSGVSWLLIISLVGVAASVYFFGLGSSMGARAAGVLVREESSGGCCGGDSSDASDAAPAPQVDFDALRRAAGAADA